MLNNFKEVAINNKTPILNKNSDKNHAKLLFFNVKEREDKIIDFSQYTLLNMHQVKRHLRTKNEINI